MACWAVGGVGGKDKLAKEFAAGDPDAARIHRLLFEQYAHLRDCPVIPGHGPYSDESRQAALDLAEAFSLSTDLPVEVVQANWARVADNVYPGEQERIDRPSVRVFTQ